MKKYISASVNNSYAYLVVTHRVDKSGVKSISGEYLVSSVVRIDGGTNLVALFEDAKNEGLLDATLCPTKQRAIDIATQWNENWYNKSVYLPTLGNPNKYGVMVYDWR